MSHLPVGFSHHVSLWGRFIIGAEVLGGVLLVAGVLACVFLIFGVMVWIFLVAEVFVGVFIVSGALSDSFSEWYLTVVWWHLLIVIPWGL